MAKSDGQAVTVTATAARTRGQYVVEVGFHGEVMNDAAAGQPVVLETAQREHMANVPAGVGGTIGAALYLSTNGTFGNAVGGAGTGTWFLVGKITRIRDANGVVYFKQLPQVGAGTAT